MTSPGLAIFGGYLLSGQLIHAGLLTTLGILILAALLLIPVTVTLYRARRSTPPAASSQLPREPLVTASTGLLTNPAARTPPGLDTLGTESTTLAPDTLTWADRSLSSIAQRQPWPACGAR